MRKIIVFIITILLLFNLAIVASADEIPLSPDTDTGTVLNLIDEYLRSLGMDNEVWIQQYKNAYIAEKNDKPYFVLSEAFGGSRPELYMFYEPARLTVYGNTYSSRKLSFSKKTYIGRPSNDGWNSQYDKTAYFLAPAYESSYIMDFHNNNIGKSYLCNFVLKYSSVNAYIPESLSDTVFFRASTLRGSIMNLQSLTLTEMMEAVLYLMPFLMALVIFSVAFWKGWQFLLTLLRKH